MIIYESTIFFQRPHPVRYKNFRNYGIGRMNDVVSYVLMAKGDPFCKLSPCIYAMYHRNFIFFRDGRGDNLYFLKFMICIYVMKSKKSHEHVCPAYFQMCTLNIDT